MKKEYDDVFGIHTDAITGKDSIVILKSKAYISCTEIDGMTDEQFEEHWNYNIAGSKGESSYSVVDDTLTLEEIREAELN